MIQRTVVVFIALVLAVSSLAMAADETATGVVNINTAGSEQLQLLPRVGPALANRIIEFRESNGLFKTVDELVAVKGIGETSLAKLEPFITTSGATTLESKVRLPRSSGSGSPAAS
jgi:competence protein ComEA